MPFGAFHWYNMLPLIAIALLVFGPKRLPEMGSAVGKTIKEFQKSMREIREPAPTPMLPITPAPALPSAQPATAAPELAPQSAAPADAATVSEETMPS